MTWSCEKVPLKDLSPEASEEILDFESLFHVDEAVAIKKLEAYAAQDQAQKSKGTWPSDLQHGTAYPFLPAGDVGGGVLTPGTFFPPTSFGFGLMQRRDNHLRAIALTSGLPAGAYTCWWVVFNEPRYCHWPIPPFDASCGGAIEELFNQEAVPSIYWATGNVVRHNGIGLFRAITKIGDDLGELNVQHVLGPGLTNPQKAEVHFVIKYHGPASQDAEELYWQLNSLLGSCEEGANAFDGGPGFGIQCFDPQVVIFPAG